MAWVSFSPCAWARYHPARRLCCQWFRVLLLIAAGSRRRPVMMSVRPRDQAPAHALPNQEEGTHDQHVTGPSPAAGTLTPPSVPTPIRVTHPNNASKRLLTIQTPTHTVLHAPRDPPQVRAITAAQHRQVPATHAAHLQPGGSANTIQYKTLLHTTPCLNTITRTWTQ